MITIASWAADSVYSVCAYSQWSHPAPGSPPDTISLFQIWLICSLPFISPYARSYSTFAERRCEGYGLPSSPLLFGGSSTTVDCSGNCQTGTGYCYSSNDGRSCGQCTLWYIDDVQPV